MSEHTETMETEHKQKNGVMVAPPHTPAHPSVALREGASWTREQIDLIKAICAKGTSDDEFKLFLYVCQRTGLDPLARQIYGIKRWSAAEKRETMAIQTGIDGYRLIAARTGQHVGTDDAIFDDSGEGYPRKASVTVYRFIQGLRVPYTASARWDESVQTTQGGEPNTFWRRMPFGQLAKCAEALALRKAFPAELANLSTYEEPEQMEPPATIPPPAEQRQRPEESKPEGEQRQTLAAVVTPPQIGFLMGVAKQVGVTEEQLHAHLATLGITSRKDIPKTKLDDILGWVKTQKKDSAE